MQNTGWGRVRMGHPTPYQYGYVGKTGIVCWQVIGVGNGTLFCNVVG